MKRIAFKQVEIGQTFISTWFSFIKTGRVYAKNKGGGEVEFFQQEESVLLLEDGDDEEKTRKEVEALSDYSPKIRIRPNTRRAANGDATREDNSSDTDNKEVSKTRKKKSSNNSSVFGNAGMGDGTRF